MTSRTHLRFETRRTLSSMSHKPNHLSWDQGVAASPREFHETDNNRTNSAALLATWQYFSFRDICFSKLLSHQKLSQIILSYFSNALSFEQGKRSFQISKKQGMKFPVLWLASVSLSVWVGTEKGVRLAWDLMSRSRITLHFGAKAVKPKTKKIARHFEKHRCVT